MVNVTKETIAARIKENMSSWSKQIPANAGAIKLQILLQKAIKPCPVALIFSLKSWPSDDTTSTLAATQITAKLYIPFAILASHCQVSDKDIDSDEPMRKKICRIFIKINRLLSEKAQLNFGINASIVSLIRSANKYVKLCALIFSYIHKSRVDCKKML